MMELKMAVGKVTQTSMSNKEDKFTSQYSKSRPREFQLPQKNHKLRQNVSTNV